MKVAILSMLFLARFAAFGENAVSTQIDEQASRYADTLVNIVFTMRHPEVFEAWLDSFKNDKDYSQGAMEKALVSIVEQGAASTNKEDLHMAKASINAIGYMMLTNTLPYLRRWTLENQQVAISSFNAYGQIVGFDERYLALGQKAVNTGTLDSWFVKAHIKVLLSLDNRLANGQKLPQYYRLKDKVRYKMAQTLFDNTGMSFEDCMGNEESLSRCLDGYTNSLEHVRAQRRIADFLIQRKEQVLKDSACRVIGDNRQLTDEEWYHRATNACQSEIARVMALPPNERLNMTAILDAKITAIEEDEARAARRVVLRRRFRLGAFIILPVLCIEFAVLFMLKREAAYGKFRWWRTVESFAVVIAMISALGAVFFSERRCEAQAVADETDPSATLELGSSCVIWQREGYDEVRHEKELADAAVLKFRVTNQLDSMVGQYESLKLGHNQLLLALTQAESRMSNETVAAEMDLLRKQVASLREKVTENVRARAELQGCISNQEHTLVQLESARELANQKYMNFIRSMEEIGFPAADSPAMNE